MRFLYKLKNGAIIDDEGEILRIHQYYEAACTGEYVQDNYSDHIEADKYSMSDKVALDIGVEVRRRMSKCDYGGGDLEEETVMNVMNDIKDNVIAFILKSNENEHIGVNMVEDFCEAFDIEDVGDFDKDEISVDQLLDWIWDDKTKTDAFNKYFENNFII